MLVVILFPSIMKKLIIISLFLLFFSCEEQISQNYIRINENNFYGFVDENGKEIIPLGIYNFLNPIDEKNMILAKKMEKMVI